MTLVIVKSLGSLYSHKGKLIESEQLIQRALKGYERSLGAEHIQTLEIFIQLGDLYIEQKRLLEAEKLF